MHTSSKNYIHSVHSDAQKRAPVLRALNLLRDMNTTKRQRIDLESIDYSYLYKTMRSLFPCKNDCASKSDLEEALVELKTFGINSKKELKLFLKRHRKWLLAVDKEPMDLMHQRIYREDIGDEEFLDAMRRQYWFCYPALIRNALEKEFGEKYDEFARKRDEI